MNKKDNIGLPRERQTWAIRGIDPETRTSCQMAARRAGMTIGEWCNRALREAATTTIQKPAVLAPQLEATLAALVKQMQADREERQQEKEELAARVSAIEARTDAQADSGPVRAGNFFERLYGLLKGR